MGHSFIFFGLYCKNFPTTALTILLASNAPIRKLKQEKQLTMKTDLLINNSKATAFSLEEELFTANTLPCAKQLTSATNLSLNTFFSAKKHIRTAVPISIKNLTLSAITTLS